MKLISACTKGDIAAVKKLVTEGADVNTKEADGRTPLLEASWGGYQDIVKFLIEKGADVNASDKAGITPLMRAAEEGHASIVSLLIQKDADVNAFGSVRGTTALMLASERGHIKVLEILVDKGAKINAVDQYEETALARAYRTNQMKAAEFLESKGGRGKPERNTYTYTDKEIQKYTKANLPQWTAGSYEGPEDQEMPGASSEDFDEQ